MADGANRICTNLALERAFRLANFAMSVQHSWSPRSRREAHCSGGLFNSASSCWQQRQPPIGITLNGARWICFGSQPEEETEAYLAGTEPSAEPSGLGPGALDELWAEVRAEPFLGAAAERPELEHREDAAVAADALASVEERPSAGQHERRRDQPEERQRDQQEERRKDDVEDAELEIDPTFLRAADENGESLNERVARPRLRSGHPQMLESPHPRVGVAAANPSSRGTPTHHPLKFYRGNSHVWVT